MDRKATLGLPRSVALRPVRRPDSPFEPPSRGAALSSPRLVRGNQELVELALQISRQVLSSDAPQAIEPAARHIGWRRLALTLAISTAAGLFLAVALWRGPMLIKAAVEQLAFNRRPAIAEEARTRPAADAIVHPVRALSPAASDMDAFGALRVDQPRWSNSAQAPLIKTVPEPQPPPDSTADTTASIMPRRSLRDPDHGQAALPIAAAALHAKQVEAAHRTRRSKRAAAPAKIMPASSVEPPAPASPDLPNPASPQDSAGRTGSSR